MQRIRFNVNGSASASLPSLQRMLKESKNRRWEFNEATLVLSILEYRNKIAAIDVRTNECWVKGAGVDLSVQLIKALHRGRLAILRSVGTVKLIKTVPVDGIRAAREENR